MDSSHSGDKVRLVGESVFLKHDASPEAGQSIAAPVSRTDSFNDDILRKWKAEASDHTYVLPCYYPRADEMRSVTCDKLSVDKLLDRLYCCFKKLNIHAHFEASFATFGLVLRTAEHLELSLLIWYIDKARTNLYLEVDKRQSGNGSFPLQYICRILKAVKCCQKTLQGNALCLPKHQEIRGGNEHLQERCRKMELVVPACAAQQEEELGSEPYSPASSNMFFTCVGEQSLSSLQTIQSLLQTPMTYCHGLELLANVSDPTKSGLDSSLMIAKVILLGISPKDDDGAETCRSVHDTLVRLMQSMVNHSNCATDCLSAYQQDCLIQLVLTCWVNAMEVRSKLSNSNSHCDGGMHHPMGVDAHNAQLMDQFLESGCCGNAEVELVDCDILETLLTLVQGATTKPHHAYLSVKALFLLSSESAAIRQHVSDAMVASTDAKASWQKTQRVGTESHGLLEAECQRLTRILQSRY